ncbi:ABC transporter ATP-binding protein [Roseococcus sp. YIM B11640]|uniref:ABC transporter ATP-binding protein n=1 Tax=Roseococcus sp. YIM B11640 TaxID=3133973 RepID=UPI003C79CC52
MDKPNTSAGPLIEARDLTFEVGSGAGRVNILRGVSLTIGEGEAVGIVGPSGSGKTSLLMLLAGLERASSGSLSVAGRDLAALDEDALARFRREEVGIVFQSFHLVPTMTALENVALPLEFAGDEHAFTRAEAALKAVGLGHRLTHYPGQLSGGEQQRVAVARAFVALPRLILADEPTGNLDRATGLAVMDLLFDLREKYGTTLILITHDPALAARCERQVQVQDGLIAADSAADAARQAEAAE